MIVFRDLSIAFWTILQSSCPSRKLSSGLAHFPKRELIHHKQKDEIAKQLFYLFVSLSNLVRVTKIENDFFNTPVFM